MSSNVSGSARGGTTARLQGELLSMLDAYVGRTSLSLAELAQQVRLLGPSSRDSTKMVREDRDDR